MNPQQRRAPQSHWIYRTPRSFLAAALSFACVTSFNVDLSSVAEAKEKKPKQDPVLKGLPIKELSADEAILHALNRLGYGPRPGDVERVRQMGLAKWIDQQLNPNSIDDKAPTARLENFPTLTMSTSRLLEEYPQPKQAEKQAERRAQAEQRPANSVTPPVANTTESTSDQASDGSGTGLRPAREMNEAANASTDESAPSPMKATSPANTATPGARRDVLGGADPNAVPRAIADDSKRPQRVIEELGMAKVARAIYSERQLQQVMDDFWFNHFLSLIHI